MTDRQQLVRDLDVARDHCHELRRMLDPSDDDEREPDDWPPRLALQLLHSIEDALLDARTELAMVAGHDRAGCCRHAERLSDERVAALRTEAGQAGDSEQVAVCDRALDGDNVARAECGRVISAALAMRD